MKKPTAKTHATYSSSSAERWTNCVGSIQMTKKALDKFGPPPESEYALEGTQAHQCLEDAWKGKKLNDYPKEMVAHANACISWCSDIQPEASRFLIETKAPLDFIGPDMGGTLDIAIVEDFGELHIIDYKFGRGHIVKPEGNLQLLAYCLSIAHHYDYNFDSYRLSIFQPRAPVKVPYRSWQCGDKELGKAAALFKFAQIESKRKNPKLKAGDHCFFCPGKSLCPEYQKKNIEKLSNAFANEVKPWERDFE